MNKLNNKILLLFLLISIISFSQKCKKPLIIDYEENTKHLIKEDYQFKIIDYQGNSIISLVYSNVTITELINKIEKKDILNKKYIFMMNCDGNTNENIAKKELLRFLIAFYDIRIIYN